MSGDAGLAVAIAGQGVPGGWRMGWCGYTIAEVTSGPTRDSCSGEGFNLSSRQAIPDFGQAGVEAGVAASRLQRQGFFTLPYFVGRHMPSVTRQRFASVRNIAAGDQSSSGRSSSSRISARSTSSLDFDVALSLEDFRSQVAGLAEHRLVCSEILCELKSS